MNLPRVARVPLLVTLLAASSRGDTIAHRWDFGTAGSPVQSGWTQALTTTKYGGTTSGFDVASMFYAASDRDPSTWLAQPKVVITLTNLQRDLIPGRKQASVPDLLWHDVIPTGATNATFTFYLGDPADSTFGMVSTLVAYASTTNFVARFSASGSVVVTNFTGQIALNGSSPTLDFMINTSSAIDGSLARWSGLEILYAIPEPTTVTFVVGAMMALVVARRRAR
jgi:hypothetical protein